MIRYPRTKGIVQGGQDVRDQVFGKPDFLGFDAHHSRRPLPSRPDGPTGLREFAGRYWPAVFIVIGLSILLNQGFKKARTGFFFIIFGAICLILRTTIIRTEFWHYAWPVLIIGAGIWLLVKPSSSPAVEDSKKKILESSSGDLKAHIVFAEFKRKIESSSFRGGEVEVVLGSADIDLTKAGLEGGRADLSLNVVLGEIVLHAPGAWRIIMDGAPVLGQIEDKRTSVPESEKSGTLAIRASAVLGQIEIRN